MLLWTRARSICPSFVADIIDLCISPFVYLSVCMSVYLSVYISIYVYVYVCEPFCVCAWLSIYSYICSFSAGIRLPLESLSVASEIETVCVLRQLCAVLRNHGCLPLLSCCQF